MDLPLDPELCSTPELLQAAFEQTVQDIADGKAEWQDAWRLLVTAPLNVFKLRREAQSAVYHWHLPPGQADDIQNSAVLSLADDFNEEPAVLVARLKEVRIASAWSATLIHRGCEKAAKSLQDKKKVSQMPPGMDAEAAEEPIDARADVRAAVEELPNAMREVMSLKLANFDVKEIATRLKRTERYVRKVLKQSETKLAWLLRAYDPTRRDLRASGASLR